MVKKFDEEFLELPKDILVGGTGLTLGSGFIARLPSVPGTPGVQRGFSTASGFFPVVATAGVLKITTNKLKKLDLKLKGGMS
jgi:hypothetical protein